MFQHPAFTPGGGGRVHAAMHFLPIPLDVDREFSKAISTSHGTGDFSLV